MPGSNPLVPLAARVLTKDYLIEGFLDTKPHESRLSAFGYSKDSNLPIWLQGARFHPTHTITDPIPGVDQRVAIYFDSFIAMIPADEAAIASMLRQNSANQYPLPAEIYAGSYHFSGKIMCLDKQCRGFEQTLMLVLQDVEISNLHPQNQLSSFRSPCMLVASRQVQSLIPG